MGSKNKDLASPQFLVLENNVLGTPRQLLSTARREFQMMAVEDEHMKMVWDDLASRGKRQIAAVAP